LETADKSLSQGYYESALHYVWHSVGLLCSVSRSPVDPNIQTQVDPWIDKAFTTLKAAREKVKEARAGIPKLANNLGGAHVMKLDEGCVDLYRKIGKFFEKEAATEIKKHLLKTSINAQVIQCQIQTKLIPTITDNNLKLKLKKEVEDTIKL
jgi:hypothetical protein